MATEQEGDALSNREVMLTNASPFPRSRTLTTEQITVLSRLLNQGYTLYEAKAALNYELGPDDLKGEAKRHGYRITRQLERLNVRRFRATKFKFSLDQLKQIDKWLDRDEFTLSVIINLIRLHGFLPTMRTPAAFDVALGNSGYTWRYALVEKRLTNEGNSANNGKANETEE